MLIAGGACAGIGFTVSLLISNLAFTGERLDEARLGVIGTVVIAPLIALAVTRVIRRLPSELRARQIGRTAQDILDLADDIDPDRDHIRGPHDAPVTLVEYGDFECPYCGQAEPVIRELLSSLGADVRYVWRHLPLNDVHPHAQLAAEASEAAATQGKFWEMYDTLLSHQDALAQADLARYAQQLALNVDRFFDELRRREYAPRISEDVATADESGVSGTPTFFINGRATTASTTSTPSPTPSDPQRTEPRSQPGYQRPPRPRPSDRPPPTTRFTVATPALSGCSGVSSNLLVIVLDIDLRSRSDAYTEGRRGCQVKCVGGVD